MKKLLSFTAILVALAFTPPAAVSALESPVDPAITSGKAAREFSAARDQWLKSGIINYRFRITAGCFCPNTGPVTVTVRGAAKKVSEPRWFGPKSVPGLFKVIHGAIKREAASLTVKYDAATGRPRSVGIDYDRMIADEEIGYTVTGFRQLPVR